MSIFKKIAKTVNKATGGLVPTNFKDALGNAVTIGTLGLSGTGNGTLGQENGGFLSNLLGNVVNGAVGLGQDYAQSQINLAMQKDLAKYNAEQQSLLNKQAFDQNVQMWNMQNAYNTPQAQMKRLEQAGLNKNLIYGSGNVTGNTAGSAPQLEPARFDTGAYHPVDTRIERAQLALAMESHYQQVQNQKIENDLARQRLVLAERSADRDDALVRAQISNLSNNISLHNKEFEYNTSKPQSWIGRNWQDIKSVGSEIGNSVYDYVYKGLFPNRYKSNH